MRPFVPVLLTALLLPIAAGRAAPGASAPARLEDDEPAPPPEEPAPPDRDAAKPDAAPQPEFPPCIDVKAQARQNGIAFDHVVTIANGCDRDASCQVTTDLNPELIAVEVPAGETRDVITFRSSPSHEFHARVRCELEQ